MPTDYEPVIGLEVHLQLSTKTKVFCGCSTLFGQRPNSHTCPVCLGLPGALPKLNKEVFLRAIKVGLALGCEIRGFVKFDRKNYYYPDLPKNFQISQYDKPVAFGGHIGITVGDKEKKIRIRRVHIEEDAGKLIHDTGGDYSCVDYNRTGMPLLEIVSEPDLASPDEAHEYLTKLKAILRYLDVSDCDMEKGSLRCDANISVRPRGTDALGCKVELKNMNTFKGVRLALAYEAKRQLDAMGSGERIAQETRLWDSEREVTAPMRTKEEAHDYRYFPEPDLVPFMTVGSIDAVRKTLPLLPDERSKAIRLRHGLSEYDTALLVSDKKSADYFEACVLLLDSPKAIANWIMGDIQAAMNERKAAIDELGFPPESLAQLLKMIDAATISGKIAKDVFIESLETRKMPEEVVKAKGLFQISDSLALGGVVKGVLERNKKSVDDYKGGKKNAFIFLVGQVMKETKGKANPELAGKILKEMLDA